MCPLLKTVGGEVFSFDSKSFTSLCGFQCKSASPLSCVRGPNLQESLGWNVEETPPCKVRGVPVLTTDGTDVSRGGLGTGVPFQGGGRPPSRDDSPHRRRRGFLTLTLQGRGFPPPSSVPPGSLPDPLRPGGVGETLSVNSVSVPDFGRLHHES